MDLQALVLAARLRGEVQWEEFTKIVFDDSSQLARLAGDSPLARPEEADRQAILIYVAGALDVLEQAMKSDPDERRVLRWFTGKKLRAFAMKTPAEVVASGGAAALVDYIQVIDVRYTD